MIDNVIAASRPARSAVAKWVCPFCPLLCDSASVTASASAGGALEVHGTECARAAAALAQFKLEPSVAKPRVDGRDCDLDTAVAAAAKLLAASRQPLFAGLGTDVSGARALYPLACATGAISDPMAGVALMQALRPLQDRGGFTTTLAEVRNRADVIVLLGAPGPNAEDFLRRGGLGEDLVAARHFVSIGHDVPAQLLGAARTTSESIPWQGDVHATAATLAALVAGRAVRDAAPALIALAARLKAATYAVIVWDAAALTANGGLVTEAVQRTVAELNKKTRAAAFPLGGSVTASTVNQVFAWLSGLPLRSRAGPGGLEHEPYCFDAKRLLADGSVDALLWISSFGPDFPLPETALPRIVIGHPSMALPADENGVVVIPVSTPGVGSAGHLFRTDGVVLMPLLAIPDYPETLPTTADVLGRITQALHAASAKGAA